MLRLRLLFFYSLLLILVIQHPVQYSVVNTIQHSMSQVTFSNAIATIIPDVRQERPAPYDIPPSAYHPHNSANTKNHRSCNNNNCVLCNNSADLERDLAVAFQRQSLGASSRPAFAFDFSVLKLGIPMPSAPPAIVGVRN